MKDELIALAKEAGNVTDFFAYLERFANLVAAKEREKVAKWMMQRALATGHGDTIEDMLVELEWQIREKEREECADIAESFIIDNDFGERGGNEVASGIYDAIRARKP